MNFIAKPIFYLEGQEGRFPARLSSRTRGEEIAAYLGAKYIINDEPFNHNETCIWLKPRHLRGVKDGDYIDVIDGAHTLLPHLKKRPKVRVIAYNIPYYEFLKNELKNEVVYIPHPHINFENKTRTKNNPIVGGMISKSVPWVHKMYSDIKEKLPGVDFRGNFVHETREDMLKFYNEIDFQVVWYDKALDEFTQYYRYPGKIVNAASFGIPTIAQPILGHKEFEGDYLPAETYDDIVEQVKKLQDEDFYNDLSQRLLKRAEPFQIDKIAEMYRRLDG